MRTDKINITDVVCIKQNEYMLLTQETATLMNIVYITFSFVSFLPGSLSSGSSAKASADVTSVINDQMRFFIYFVQYFKLSSLQYIIPAPHPSLVYNLLLPRILMSLLFTSNPFTLQTFTLSFLLLSCLWPLLLPCWVPSSATYEIDYSVSILFFLINFTHMISSSSIMFWQIA